MKKVTANQKQVLEALLAGSVITNLCNRNSGWNFSHLEIPKIGTFTLNSATFGRLVLHGWIKKSSERKEGEGRVCERWAISDEGKQALAEPEPEFSKNELRFRAIESRLSAIEKAKP